MIANSDNKLLRKKPNRLLTARRNYFVVGGTMGNAAFGTNYSTQPRQYIQSPIVPIDSGMGGAQNPNKQYNTQSNSNLNIDQGQGGSNNNSMGLAAGIGAIGMQAASDVAGLINNIQSNDIKADADNRIKDIQSKQMSPVQGADSYDRLFADYANSDPLEHVTAKQMGALNAGQMFGNAFVAGNKGFASGASLGPLAGGIAATGSTLLSLFGSAARNRMAKEQADRVNQYVDYTLAYNDRMLNNRADNIADMQMNDLLVNSAAFGGQLYDIGGPVTRFYNKGKKSSMSPVTDFYRKQGGLGGGTTGGGGVTGHYVPGSPEYTLEKDTIYVPAQQTFNDAFKEARGRGDKTFEFNGKKYTTELGNNPDNWEYGNKRTREVIVPIERTRRVKKKSFGGELNTQGGDFTNGLLFIDNGGSHESNPYEGVQLGVDPEGTPNLVEEGETVFNDYVFSKRLKVPKAIRNKYKLGGQKSISFADASKKLAKESEERPNDPISQRGLEAMLGELAISQESLKASRQERQYKNGGKLFWDGGYKWFGQDEDDAMQFMQNGDYTDDYRKYVENISELEMAANYATLQKFYKNATPEQRKTRRWKNLNAYFSANPTLKDFDFSTGKLPEGLYDFTKSGGLDGKIGGRHYGIMSAEQRKAMFGDDAAKSAKAVNRYLEYGTGTPLDYFEGRDKVGKSWFDLNPGYEFVDKKGIVRDPVDVDGVSTTYTDYFLRKKNTAKDRYYIEGDDGKYSEVTGDNPYLDIANRGGFSESKRTANTLGGNDLYFSKDKKVTEYKELPTWMRYAPAVGLGLASLTDALGLTNKPDYKNADALLEASRGAGTYQPVRFKPIGNYLTYKPFDRNYYINKMNAEAGASRRAILNTASGNRATAMAGILAADNNYLNQLGNLARQGEEYNLAQRQQVENFNRSTNITNSQGLLQADMANQKALMNARELSLKGTMSALDMRDRARLMSDQAKSANLSGLFTSIGDIGRENMAWNWRNFGLATDSFNPIGDEQQYLLGYTGKKNPNVGAKGGKIKRKKGLTI